MQEKEKILGVQCLVNQNYLHVAAKLLPCPVSVIQFQPLNVNVFEGCITCFVPGHARLHNNQKTLISPSGPLTSTKINCSSS